MLKGQKATPEQKERMSKAAKKRCSNLTKEEKLEMTKALHTKEVREKVSKSLKGRKAWNKGVTGVFHHSDETKKKISEASKGKAPWCKGKKLSKEIVDKMVKSRINFYRNNPTSIEVKVAEQLEKYGINYVYQKPVCNGHFIVDFWIPEYQLVIECNGDYWHKLSKRKERDKELEEYVFSKGKDILWLWQHEIDDDWFDIADYLEV